MQQAERDKEWLKTELKAGYPNKKFAGVRIRTRYLSYWYVVTAPFLDHGISPIYALLYHTAIHHTTKVTQFLPALRFYLFYFLD